MSGTAQDVAYGVQRGRARELRRLEDDLEEMLEDPMADEGRLRTYVRELKIRRRRIEAQVDGIERGDAA